MLPARHKTSKPYSDVEMIWFLNKLQTWLEGFSCCLCRVLQFGTHMCLRLCWTLHELYEQWAAVTHSQDVCLVLFVSPLFSPPHNTYCIQSPLPCSLFWSCSWVNPHLSWHYIRGNHEAGAAPQDPETVGFPRPHPHSTQNYTGTLQLKHDAICSHLKQPSCAILTPHLLYFSFLIESFSLFIVFHSISWFCCCILYLVACCAHNYNKGILILSYRSQVCWLHVLIFAREIRT